MSKIRLGVLFGGRSAEHAISLLSAKNVISAIDREKYDVVLIGINPEGQWFLYPDLNQCLSQAQDPQLIALKPIATPITLASREGQHTMVHLSSLRSEKPLDVVFPVLHGTYGEDGTIQGLLKLLNVPFVGSGVLASAVGMDKDVMKRLLRDAKISIAPFMVLQAYNYQQITFETIVEQLGLPFFIKPANLGSSIGISKVKHKAEYVDRLKHAFQFDRKVILERNIVGREIECSVLGNENPRASLPGELIPQHEFYSYEAKYLDQNGALFQIPAQLPTETVMRIQALAIQTFQVLACEGMARVDMFLQEDGQLIINEINTIPGFTEISMYPKMWAATGLSYSDLIEELIQLAIERFNQEKALKTSPDFTYEKPVLIDHG